MGLLAARTGRATLIVSTDPAPSLGDALKQRLTRVPRPVHGVAHLHAVEVDAALALAGWLKRRRGLLEQIALRGTWLDADDVARLLRLSLPGIDEIAGLLQLGEFAESGRYDHITAAVVLQHIDEGDVFEFLARELGNDLDLRKLTDVHRHALLQHWRIFARGYETRQFHVAKGGLSLLVAYLLHLIQCRHVQILT